MRDDHAYWQDVEHYVAEHADVRFSHGICPACYEQKVKPMLEDFRLRHGASGAERGA